jgi:hypothetical protein
MGIRVALHHKTLYKYDRLVTAAFRHCRATPRSAVNQRLLEHAWSLDEVGECVFVQ